MSFVMLQHIHVILGTLLSYRKAVVNMYMYIVQYTLHIYDDAK